MLTTEQSALYVEAFLIIPFLLMGLSHVVQPGLWRDYFMRLHTQGETALVTRTFELELWPALLIVTFHQVWSGPATIITVYGHMLALKITLALLYPKIGMRSLGMAEESGRFIAAGGVLMSLGALCIYLARTSLDVATT